MSNVIFPDSSRLWYLSETVPESIEYSTETENSVIIDMGDSITVDLPSITSEYSFDVFTAIDEGISMADEKLIALSVKFSPLPNQFSKCYFYIEDELGVQITYGVTRKELGKMVRFPTSTCVDNEDFNSAFVVKFGFHFEGVKTDSDFKLNLSSLATSSVNVPTYADPQETIRFLGMLDNDSKPFILSYDSYPSYEYICDLITQAESHIDQATHMSWRENREVDEIQNSNLSSFPSGIYSNMWAFRSLGGIAGDAYLKGYPITLNRQNIRPIDYSKGDKVEIRLYGNNWETVPNSNIWADETKGIIFIKKWFFQKEDAVRVTYRWGLNTVPDDISKCAKLMACQQIIQTDWYRAKFPLSPEFQPLKSETLNSWVWQIKDILKNYQNDASIGYL